MRKILVIATLTAAFMSAPTSWSALQWGSGINVITDFDSNPVATSDSFDPTVGAFAQLIRILVGTDPYNFVASGSGIDTFNEQVLDVMYSGQYDDLADPGTFTFTPTPILNNSSFNGWYYVRVFDSPQATLADWNEGTDAPIPSGAQYYFQSNPYQYTHNELETSIFNFGSGQTLNAIPEPGTMALLAAGLIGVAAIRRKRLAA